MSGAATEKQIKFIRSLADGRELEVEHREAILERLDSGEVSKKLASEWITRLLDKPKKPKASWGIAYNRFPSPEVLPAGRYCVESAGGDLRFYKVWRGRQKPEYVKVYVLHGPNESELPFPAIGAILDQVAEDPRAAAIRYGHETTHCCICGLRLTNRLSRELGIGPICGGRFYEAGDWSQAQYEAREAILDRGEDPSEAVELEYEETFSMQHGFQRAAA